ncbi:MAG: EamA family transporter [Spirochaetaceae bacterium]|jgi:multidrug transporter EmrE-like cation transporter|nr:EamA family transporter [Spirochaetaceae bacterium]
MKQSVLAILYLVFTLSGLFLFKANSACITVNFEKHKLSSQIPWLAFAGIICYAFSFLIWLLLIKNNNLSFIFPVLNGIVVVLTVLGGLFIFHEKTTLTQSAGIVFIIAGLVLVNYSKK